MVTFPFPCGVPLKPFLLGIVSAIVEKPSFSQGLADSCWNEYPSQRLSGQKQKAYCQSCRNFLAYVMGKQLLHFQFFELGRPYFKYALPKSMAHLLYLPFSQLVKKKGSNIELKWGHYGVEPLTNATIYLSASDVLGVFVWPVPFMCVCVCVCMIRSKIYPLSKF